MFSACLTSCHAAQWQSSAGHSIPVITGQRVGVTLLPLCLFQIWYGLSEKLMVNRMTLKYDDWQQVLGERGSGQSEAHAHTLKATTLFPYHLPKGTRHGVSIWSFLELVEIYERQDSDHQNKILFIQWKHFATFL